MSAGLAILACGMTTAVGLTAPATCAAFRARLDNFRETRFIARGGEWLIGAEVPLEEPWRGLPRLAHLLVGPIRECLDAEGNPDPAGVPLLLVIAEKDRPGRLEGLDGELFAQLCDLVGGRFHESSRIIPHGRVGGAVALREAGRLLQDPALDHVLIAGVDTYLVAATLRAFDETSRLLTPANSNGFIPGEAGAAVLVGRTNGRPAHLFCLSVGLATEQATITSEEPLRGDGLCQAFRQALAAAGLEMAQIGYRLGTMSGEQYWFKEFELATSRLLRGRHEFMDLWHPADAIGEVGAASLPCLLGVALDAARKRYAPGNPVLISASNDDGRRAAAVLAGKGD
jgi:3-oxoacyl-[acyl-carrier-protein] synthase-1